MWGTDGVRVFTAEDGWVWTLVDHWNAECVGWHVCKVGSPSRKGSGDSTARSRRTWPAGWRYGWITAASLSDHFLNHATGASTPASPSLKSETNGVVERWNRTLKEQAVYGRVFRNLAEVRAAVAAFVERVLAPVLRYTDTLPRTHRSATPERERRAAFLGAERPDAHRAQRQHHGDKHPDPTQLRKPSCHSCLSPSPAQPACATLGMGTGLCGRS